MLNITRRAGERIIVGEDIIVTVLEISGQSARIGIEAPRDVTIYREEIWADVKRENEAAAAGGATELPSLPAEASAPSSPVAPAGAHVVVPPSE